MKIKGNDMTSLSVVVATSCCIKKQRSKMDITIMILLIVLVFVIAGYKEISLKVGKWFSIKAKK